MRLACYISTTLGDVVDKIAIQFERLSRKISETHDMKAHTALSRSSFEPTSMNPMNPMNLSKSVGK